VKPFLIDECLSSALAAVAKERGVQADFAPHIGLAGWQDWNLVRFAFDHNYIVVTNNRRDFLKEYAKQDLHGGLVILVPHGDRAEQIDLFSRVLDHLAEMNEEPVNKLIEVLEDGTIHVREWTRHVHDTDHVGSPIWKRT
jgi:predicted nuclease of predicted toxin-antitoxin system